MNEYPQDAILAALLRGQSKGMTVTQLRLVTGRAESTVRNHLAVMADCRYRDAWVEKVWTKPISYRLTERGREVAHYRALPRVEDDAS